MKKEEDIIGTDFQGWPIYRMNIREILDTICVHKDGQYVIKDNDQILDLYPRVLEDDGMGYGINEKYITNFYIDNDDNYCNIFIDRENQ